MSETFGEALRSLRKRRGMGLRALARDAHVDPGHLSRVEGGHRPPTRELAAAVDVALRADGDLVAIAEAQLAPTIAPVGIEAWHHRDSEAFAAALVGEAPSRENALRLAHEWMIAEPPQVYEVRAGRQIGARTVDQVEQRVHQLRLLDDHVGGTDTYANVRAELAATADLLRTASYTEPLGKRLLVAIGELCQLAGWVASDAGRYSIAEHLYLVGVRASHAGGDTAGAANNLSSLSYQVANVGRPADAVILARSALCGAHQVPATVRALLLERVAWAQARVDDDRACDRALGDVEDAYAQRRPDDDPIWVYWLDADEIAVMAGRCWTQLRRPLRAVPILERAVAGYGDDVARETSLYLTWLAEALTQAHEVDQAATVAERALTLAADAGSIRATDRIDVIRRLLRPYRNRPAVTAFDDRYRAWKADSGQQPEA